jgi:hypothetical protein
LKIILGDFPGFSIEFYLSNLNRKIASRKPGKVLKIVVENPKLIE